MQSPCMEVRQKNIFQQGGNESGLSLNVNIFCLEHFYTICYDTFLHTFLCSTTYQKLVFYPGIPLMILENLTKNPWSNRSLISKALLKLVDGYGCTNSAAQK